MIKKRIVKRLVIGVAALAVLGGVVEILIHRYDPTRVLYKRLKADNAYVYDEINPKFLETDPRSLLSVATLGEVAILRARLINLIWGGAGFPVDSQPAMVETAISVERLDDLPNLASIDRLTVDMGRDVRSYLYLLKPANKANGKLVIYHHGFAGDIRDVPAVLGGFLARGYAVLGVNLMAYGGNTGILRTAEGELFNLHFDLDRIERPLRYHLEPLVVGVNYLLREGSYQSINLVGFSAGAFVATVMAAIDGRISRSYLVAGVYPIYLREGPEIQLDMPSTYPPLLARASYLDLFTLGASGPGRRQLQIFNRYDRCCYKNTKGKLYESAVAEAVRDIGDGGGFGVFIDESHADHRLSMTALEVILAHMAAD
jgi:pimeloyl-ACP methyl ester carboxylesterase